ncbi:hypothetical protein ACFE04_014152 [Oxalis oulophora]
MIITVNVNAILSLSIDERYRIPTEWTSGMIRLKPSVDTFDMKVVLTLGKLPNSLALFDLVKTHCAQRWRRSVSVAECEGRKLVVSLVKLCKKMESNEEEDNYNNCVYEYSCRIGCHEVIHFVGKLLPSETEEETEECCSYTLNHSYL